jgi:hypothetical protein
VHLFVEPVRRVLGDQPITVSTDGFLPAKRAALAEHASQTTNLTGEASWVVMDDHMLAPFLQPSEVFLSPRELRTST